MLLGKVLILAVRVVAEGVLGLLVLLLAIPHLLKVVTQLFRVKVLVNL